ncbi:MAG: hypothetical protein R3A10_10775 [Caldilineaceae bacterium]
MTASDGGFYSTQDADSEGEEGKFFVWTPQEIEAVLGPQMYAIFEDYYDVSTRGNFEGKSILNVVKTVEEWWPRAFPSPRPTWSRPWPSHRQALFDEREQRVKPGRDEKILTEWNGLMIHALAECGAVPATGTRRRLRRRRGHVHLGQHAPARRASLPQLQGRPLSALNAFHRRLRGPGARLIALLRNHVRTPLAGRGREPDRAHVRPVPRPARGGFFQTGVDHEALVVRRKDFIDNAIPSGNSLAAESLLRLAELDGPRGVAQRGDAHSPWP